MKVFDVFGLALVGAFWGCTNPWLRKGSAEAKAEEAAAANDNETKELSLVQSVLKFKNLRVWLPYVLNQAGSVVYYILFATSDSDLTLAVPICNGLALVFSCLTSYLLGERVDKPIQAMLGATLVMMGVALCMVSSSSSEPGVKEDEL